MDDIACGRNQRAAAQTGYFFASSSAVSHFAAAVSNALRWVSDDFPFFTGILRRQGARGAQGGTFNRFKQESSDL